MKKVKVREDGLYPCGGSEVFVRGGSTGVVLAGSPSTMRGLLRLDDGREVWVSWSDYALADD